MTITTLVNGVTVGTAGAVASNTSETALAASTVSWGISAMLTNGAKNGNRQKTVRVYCAVAPYGASFTASTAPDSLRQVAQILEVIPHTRPGGILVSNMGPFAAIGDTLWVWVEEPTLDAAATLTVKLVEF